MTSRTLTATLPSDTLYVSGTVNGIATTWTNTESNIWQTIADRAVDDIYRVSLTMISSAGTSAQASFVLYYGVLNLITDRTNADVQRVKALAAKGWSGMTAAEKTEWLAGMKGSYNATDLNRVAAAVTYISDHLQSCGYSISVRPKLSWSMKDLPTQAEMKAYLADIAAVRAVFDAAVLPAVPADMDKLTYAEANDIELILKDADQLITNMIAAMFYSGEVYSGEE